MQFYFANPLLLWLYVPLALHVLWMSRRLQMISGARRIAAVALRLVILALLICALAGVRFSRQSKDLTVLFVMDASDSLPEAQRNYEKAYLQKALADQNKQRDRAGVIVFGADAALEQGPVSHLEVDQVQSVINPARTNIADALQLAIACFVGESQKRIVLLSDGNQNAGNAEEAARSAAAAEIAVDVVPLEYESRNDVILEKAVVENRVSLEEPFDIKIIASSRVATTGKLSVHQDGKLIAHSDVKLDGGRKTVFQIPTQVRDAGFHTFEVQIDADGDMIPENNRAFAFTYGEGEPRVLYVDGDAQPSQALPAMLLSEKIKIEVINPAQLPGSLRDLQSYDAVIFNNVGAGDISLDQMKIIERAVHDLGLGFIMIGGEKSFGAGGYTDSPIAHILPVELELKNEKVMPQGALVPVIHTIEIPQGQYWSEQIALSALDVLSPRDLMGVLYYSWQGGESWLFPLQEVGDKSKLRAMIKGLQPGDMPSFDKILQMAYTSLANCGASVKHIVIISDGDPQTPNQALVNQVLAAKITISTVCINPHSPRDSTVMQELARIGGGNYYNVTSYNTLPQIFIKEATTVRKSLIVEEPFAPVVKQASPLLEGFGKDYPVLQGYVGTETRSLADTPLLTAKGNPLLAHWRHGIGKTVAFTSDAKQRWANAWLTWDQFGKFWAQTVRWALRSPFNQNYQVEMNIDGSKGKVLVDAVDGKGDFRNFLNMAGQVISPTNEAQAVTFHQTAAGRYEADFDVKEPGTYMLGATSQAEAGGAGDLLTAGTTLSYSPEFQNSASNQALLYRLADITHGRVLDAKANVFDHNLPSHTEPQPLWPSLLVAALLLFLLDVFLRRVLVGWKEIGSALAVAANWLRGKTIWRPAAASGPVDQLLKIKHTAKPLDRQKGQERADFLASLKDAKISKSPLKSAEPKPRLPSGAAQEKPPPKIRPRAPQHEEFTSQLLKARERAQSKIKKKPEEGDKKP